MSYLDNAVAEMKARIMIIYEHLKNAQTEQQASRYTDELEGIIRGKLIESFKNGIELGRKKRGSRR